MIKTITLECQKTYIVKCHEGAGQDAISSVWTNEQEAKDYVEMCRFLYPHRGYYIVTYSEALIEIKRKALRAAIEMRNMGMDPHTIKEYLNKDGYIIG